MAIRAVISDAHPQPDSEEIWVGALGVDGDDGVGLTTAAILSFVPNMDVGTWYRLAEFAANVASVDWDHPEEHAQWTSLEITESSAEGSAVVTIEVKLADAVKTLCQSAVEHLSAFSSRNVWIRFE
ncbi:hypothetical protein GGE07_000536 [Sinorhizobium terangae]|uniref:Uncharacterized protein n=1 Tax=Sinorhizobium terangae TaxID=110322 RepID=A0A6N7LEB1_SINTE|nr:hypothetical protein [Sinorhizobium terangae]MBB4183923.1 hypothetical protein [Sinorhizobium terangae]MQX15054.1 hypothetical protein [Sinorhizobium terangae]